MIGHFGQIGHGYQRAAAPVNLAAAARPFRKGYTGQGRGKKEGPTDSEMVGPLYDKECNNYSFSSAAALASNSRNF